MKIPQPRTVPAIVKQFYGVISQPVRYASLFYTYYYLVEVENIRELRRDFEKIIDELWVAFYNYGIYSVGRELQQHVYGELRLETTFLDMEVEYAASEMDKYLITVYPSMKTVERGKTIELYIFFYREFKQAGPIITTKDFEAIKKFCMTADIYTSMFRRPSTFLQYAYNLFNLPHIEGDFYGWMREYGGESWAKICKTLLIRNKTRPTIFVDACWNIQHNTGVWLNKVNVSEKEIEPFDVALKVADYLDIIEINPYSIINKIFDYNLEGKMENILSVAMIYEPSLDKYKRYVE